MGRPTKLTSEREGAILDALREGNSRTVAARLAGVGEATLRDWMARYPRIRAAIEKAEAEAEVAHVANIAQAAKDGTWQASAWWLERRQHAAWGKRVQVDITQTIVEMVRDAGLGEDIEAEALAEAESIMRNVRGRR